LVEVELIVNNDISPSPSLGIRVVGVNMIHGVQDKLNIYVKKVVEDSLAGRDGRILLNDHIIEVNGVRGDAATLVEKCAREQTLRMVLKRAGQTRPMQRFSHRSGLASSLQLCLEMLR